MREKKKFTLLTAFVLLISTSTISKIESTGFHDHDVESSHTDMHKHDEEIHNEEHHGEHHEEHAVRLSDHEVDEFEIEIDKVSPGKLRVYSTLAGEVLFNDNRLAHIVPRIPGVVRKVFKNYGDDVKENEILAVIESSELADLKGYFFESVERFRLAQSKYEREKGLWLKKISSEQDYLESKQAFEEARIKLYASEQKLRAIGLRDQDLIEPHNTNKEALTYYEVLSPIDGRIVEKHLTVGEKIEHDSNAFTIADLSNVWVDLIVYQKDMDKIQLGQEAHIVSRSCGVEDCGKISYVSSFLDGSTRTGTARIDLNNKAQNWKPGMFISARVNVEEMDVPMMVALTAIQNVEGHPTVFVREGDEFHAVPVELGRSDHENVEVISGLLQDMDYVKKNSFTLKAELEKGSFGHGHSH